MFEVKQALQHIAHHDDGWADHLVAYYREMQFVERAHHMTLHGKTDVLNDGDGCVRI